MKIAIINGQNHKGSTWHIGNMLAEKIPGEKETKEFFLPRNLNHFCLGCYACLKNRSACPYTKEKEPIMKAMLEADLLIFTTPNYCMMPSAPLKSFLDLFFTNWLSHKPYEKMFFKKAVIISTAAGAGAAKAIKPVKNNLIYWEIPKVYTYGIAVNAMNWNQVPDKKKAKINKATTQLARRVTKGTSRIGMRTKALFWVFGGMQKANWSASPEEKQYWAEKGWLAGKKPWKK